jgi:hypothetical protein
MTAHWIDVNTASWKWTLWAEVVGFRLIRGTHTGSNLGCYFVGLCDRVGITLHSHSKVCPCLFSFNLHWHWWHNPALYSNTWRYVVQQHSLWYHWVSTSTPEAPSLVSHWTTTAMSAVPHRDLSPHWSALIQVSWACRQPGKCGYHIPHHQTRHDWNHQCHLGIQPIWQLSGDTWVYCYISIILRHKYRGNSPIRSENSTYWESQYGNTQYGNGHVTIFRTNQPSKININH